MTKLQFRALTLIVEILTDILFYVVPRKYFDENDEEITNELNSIEAAIDNDRN